MSRTVTAGVATELQKTGAGNSAKPVALVHLAFDSGAVRLWSGVGDLVFSGDTYTGAGTLGSVSLIEESSSLKATGVVLTLSGIDSSIITIALGEHYQGRTVQMWLGFLDTSYALIVDPLLMFQGRMDVMTITDHGATATISITAESRAIDLERANKVLFYSDQSQQALFAGDKFFEFVPEMQEKVIVWGRAVLGEPTQLTNPGTIVATGPVPVLVGHDPDGPIFATPSDPGAGSNVGNTPSDPSAGGSDVPDDFGGLDF